MSSMAWIRSLTRRSRLLGAAAAGLSLAGIALAADARSAEDRVRALLKTRLRKTSVTAIDCGKVGGLCEITAGANLFYVDSGDRDLLMGRVYDVQKIGIGSWRERGCREGRIRVDGGRLK